MITEAWPPALLIVHAAATWWMAGLIWFVQVVHYPLMAEVGADRFPAYERNHTRRTTLVVAPAMLIEASCAAALVMLQPRSVLAITGAVIAALLWLSTFAVQVPLHARLERGFDAAAHRRLVRSNWLRTAAWTVRGGIACMMLRPP